MLLLLLLLTRFFLVLYVCYAISSIDDCVHRTQPSILEAALYYITHTRLLLFHTHSLWHTHTRTQLHTTTLLIRSKHTTKTKFENCAERKCFYEITKPNRPINNTCEQIKAISMYTGSSLARSLSLPHSQLLSIFIRQRIQRNAHSSTRIKWTSARNNVRSTHFHTLTNLCSSS